MANLSGSICSSCGRLASEYVNFKCPSCGKEEIIRCQSCREKYVRYKCSVCSYEGP